MSKQPRELQSVVVTQDDDTEIEGLVVDVLSTQFTYLPLDEDNPARVKFCRHDGDWKDG